MPDYFVTGTDTDVGKTTVARALLLAARSRGLTTRCYKPAESGCPVSSDGSLLPQDALALWDASGRVQPRESICSYCFREPIAPGVDAERGGIVIDFERIYEQLRALQGDDAELLIVEGAGGLLVPMGQDRMIRDLASRLGLPLIIVARPGLGTINHTLLTIESARAAGLDLAGIIFSARLGGFDSAAIASNRAEIERAAAVPVLGCLPPVSNESATDLIQITERSIDLGRLF